MPALLITILRQNSLTYLPCTRVNAPKPSLFKFSTTTLAAFPSAPIVNVAPLKPTAFSPPVS